MHKLPKKARWLLPALLASPLAVKADTTPTIDTSAATTYVGALKDKVSEFLTGDMMQAALAIIGAAVVIWLLFIAWKLIKKAGAKAG